MLNLFDTKLSNPFDLKLKTSTPQVEPKHPFADTGLGLTLNTIRALPDSAFNVAKDIGQGLARDTVGLGRTIANTESGAISKATGKKVITLAPTYTAPKVLQPVLGKEPIKTSPERVKEVKAAIESSPFAQKTGIGKFSGPLAVGAVFGENTLDFAPLGGSEKSAVKALVKETDTDLIRGMLQKTGLHSTIADKLAPEIAASNDSKEIKTLLDTAKGLEHARTASVGKVANAFDIAKSSVAGTERVPYIINAKGKDLSSFRNVLSDIRGFVDPAKHDRIEIQNIGKRKSTQKIFLPEAAEHAAEEIRPREESRLSTEQKIPETQLERPTESIPEHLKPLAEEARKYKSAEEFVSKQQPIYHGTTVENFNFDPRFETYLTNRKHDALEYTEERLSGEGRGKILEFYPNLSRPKILTTSEEHARYFDNQSQNTAALQKLKKEGYDGIIFKNKNGVNEYRVFSGESKLLTKEQLTDFYTQSTKNAERGAISPAETNSLEETAASHGTLNPERPSMNIGHMDPTIEEQFARRVYESTPGATIQKLAKSPEKGSWQSLIKGFSRKLPKEKLAHFFDYFATPEFVLEKIGLQKGAELLQEAKDAYRVSKKAELGKIIDWKKLIERDGKPFSYIRIFRYLNGDARYAKSEMTPTEIRVAKEIKDYLKEWADRLHLPEDSRISDYITHVFDKDAVDIPIESAFDDPELAMIMQDKIAKSVYNPFLDKRVNKPGYKEDVWAALDAYVKRATRKEAMDPALSTIESMAGKLDESSYLYVKHMIDHVNMRPTQVDKAFDNWVKDTLGNKFTQRPTAYISNKIRTIFYRGLLALNPASALRNLSQGANTYAKLGEKYTTIGYFKLFTKMATRNLQELYDHGVLDEGLVQDKKMGVYKTRLQKLDPALFSLFEMAEKINRGAAFFGAKSRGLAKGLTEEEALKYAKRIVRETQFAFGSIDSPVALASDLMKTATQLHSFDIKQGEFLYRMAKNKEFAGLLRWTASSLFFMNTIGKLFGMNLLQLIPSFGLGNSPLVNLVEAGVNIPAGILGGDKQKTQQGVQDFTRNMWAMIPAGAQIRKSLQGFSAYSAGKDVTATGKTRFKIKQTPTNAIRATVFGKSSLPEAQDYYRKLNSTTKKKKALPNI